MSKPEKKHESAIFSTLIYIQTHLNESLDLNNLANRVGYSPYHFHRTFREFVGEPVKEHIRRLRLERGAYRLKISEESILKIALDAGFKSHESFTRAFVRQFETTPLSYRKDFLRLSHARKRKIAPEYLPMNAFKKDSGLLPNQTTATQVRLERVRPLIVAFVRHVGPYEDVLEENSPLSKLWEDLFRWGNDNGLINADSLLLGIPQDDPSITQPEKQRFDVAVQISSFKNPSGRIGCQTIQAGTFGVGRHYGSFDNLAETYAHIYDTLVVSGNYQMRLQAPFEVYHFSRVKEEFRIHFTDVYLPVERLEKRG